MTFVYTFIALCVAVYLSIPLLLWLLRPNDPDTPLPTSVAVVVLGDLNRSPRMCNHALSLAKRGAIVTLCGYGKEQEIRAGLTDSKDLQSRIQICIVPELARKKWPVLPYGLFLVLKTVSLSYNIIRMLYRLRGINYVLVQVPPAIPVLVLLQIFVYIMSPGTKLVIDWHNLGYSLLALKLGDGHVLTRVYLWYEKLLGRFAFAHVTVSDAMKAVLKSQFSLHRSRVMVLHDRPVRGKFRVVDEEERRAIRAQFPELFGNLKPDCRVVITSTSYTPDEDLKLFLQALKVYVDDTNNPPLRIIITGKGPMYDEIQACLANLRSVPQFSALVSVKTAWLPTADYPKVLSGCDFGVSLHYSSSGWDLPMKVVDMFGCGLPVVSLAYEALPELVKEGVNGLTVEDIKSPVQLASAIKTLATNKATFTKLKTGAVLESRDTWEHRWGDLAVALFGLPRYGEE